MPEVSISLQKDIVERRAHANQKHPAAPTAPVVLMGTPPTRRSEALKKPATSNLVRLTPPITATTTDDLSKASRQTPEATLSSIAGADIANCSPMPCRSFTSCHVDSNQTTESGSGNPEGNGGEGPSSSQGLPSDGGSSAWSLSPAPPSRRRSMESDGEDDGNDEDPRKSLKHSHDESDDGSDSSEKRKRRCRTKQGTESVQTYEDSKNPTDDGPPESPPFVRDIALATIPDHLLNTPTFTNPPRYLNRPRGHTNATGSDRDITIKLVERRNSVRDEENQDIPQYDGAADDGSLMDDIGTADIVTLSHNTSGTTSGVLSDPALDQPGFDSAEKCHSPAAPLLGLPTATAQTDGPVDDDLTDDSLAGEQLMATRTWSWVKGDDKAAMSANPAAEPSSPEEQSGNAHRGRSVPANTSLPVRLRSALAHPSTHLLAVNSPQPTPGDSTGDSTGDSGVSTQPSSADSLVSAQVSLIVPGAPQNSLRSECTQNRGNQVTASEATLTSGPTTTGFAAGPPESADQADSPIPTITTGSQSRIPMVTSIDGHGSITEELTGDEERIPSVASGCDSWSFVRGTPGIPLTRMDELSKRAGSDDVVRGRQDSASSTSTCGYCGCSIIDALVCMSCSWFKRRDNQPQAHRFEPEVPQTVPDMHDGPPAPPSQPQASEIELSEDVRGTASAARRESLIPPAPSLAAEPQESPSAHQAGRGRYNGPVNRWSPGFGFGFVHRTEEQVLAQRQGQAIAGPPGVGNSMPHVGWNLVVRTNGAAVAQSREPTADP